VQILSVYPQPTIAARLVDLLIGALPEKGADVWLVSPWITDFSVSLETRGPLLPLLGRDLEHTQLSVLVGLVARWNTVHVVVRPPSELVGRGELSRLAALLRARRQLLPLARQDETVREVLSIMERESEDLVTAAISNGDTVRLAARLRTVPGVKLHFNPRLHTKLLVTPRAALLGSANFTYSGMSRNDEIALIVDSPADVAALRRAAEATASRPFSLDANEYSFLGSLPEGERTACLELLDDAATPQSLADLLRVACQFAA